MVVDSLSSIQAIHTYRDQYSSRKRMRMNGRPLLAIIDQLISSRIKYGGEVHFEHVHSHTNMHTTHGIGNRIVDYAAKHYANQRTWSNTSKVRCLSRTYHPQIPMLLGQPYVQVYDVHMYMYNDQLHRKTKQASLIYDDIRQVVAQCLAPTLIHKWQNSKTQSMYAGADVLPMANFIYKHYATNNIAITTLLGMITNTIHHVYHHIQAKVRSIIHQQGHRNSRCGDSDSESRRQTSKQPCRYHTLRVCSPCYKVIHHTNNIPTQSVIISHTNVNIAKHQSEGHQAPSGIHNAAPGPVCRMTHAGISSNPVQHTTWLTMSHVPWCTHSVYLALWRKQHCQIIIDHMRVHQASATWMDTYLNYDDTTTSRSVIESDSEPNTDSKTHQQLIQGDNTQYQYLIRSLLHPYMHVHIYKRHDLHDTHKHQQFLIRMGNLGIIGAWSPKQYQHMLTRVQLMNVLDKPNRQTWCTTLTNKLFRHAYYYITTHHTTYYQHTNLSHTLVS
jgi:hypothetical protein